MGLYLNLMAYVTPGKAGLKGFLLFCRPFKVPFNVRQETFFATADRYKIRHDDREIQVYRWGSGPKKILFLHGWQSHTYRWKSYIEALPKDLYTVYALDAPGHGASDGNFLSVPLYSDLIQQFITELGKVEAVVAHSLGGFSLLYTFHRFPLIPVHKVVLLGVPGEASDFVEVFSTALGLSKRTLALVHDHFVSQYDVGPEYFSAAKFATSVNVSGLIIHDKQDNEAPYQHALDINKAWKRSRLITTSGLGHNLKSMEVVSAVASFIGDDQPVVAREPAHFIS